MKIKKIYVCEICEKSYSDKSSTLYCEKQGIPKSFPVGLVFSHNSENMVFGITKIVRDGHRILYLTHATRDTGAGDNKIGDNCGFDVYPAYEGHRISGMMQPDKTSSCYERMLRDLSKMGIKPVVYDGGDACGA